jgi:phospholipid/cholesterol/gamma-HCH transport system substrate-binding protein
MRRIAAILLAVGATIAVLAVGTAAGGDDDVYEVRAIFDNAGFLVDGEEVRVAGANVGVVTDVTVTGNDEPALEDGGADPGKAVVVMRIDDPAFQDFREDASCLIRPQSLIGEKFVECEPTQPHAASSEPPPPLERIPDGEPGEGQYLLPLERNGKAVDLDLVNNIMEEPYPDRFRLILNDLGAGFAARGEELAEIIERANPALRETNEVLAILARQNRVLAQLSTDSDVVLGALARERARISSFINQSDVVASATAERSADLEESFARFPSFLRELRSTMDRLDAFSTAATPVFSDLGDTAPSLTRLSRELEPFSTASTLALTSLGTAAEGSGPNLAASDPVIREVRGLAKTAQPAAANLRKLLASVRETDGFSNLTELVFNGAGAVNAFDQYGHFIRGLLPTNNCVDYDVVPEASCSANFVGASTTAAAGPGRDRERQRDRKRGSEQEDAGPRRLPRRADGHAPQRADGQAFEVTREDPDLEPGELDVDAAPAVPEAAPETARPTAGQMRATRDLLDFLIGARPADRRSKTREDDGGER